MRGVIGQAVLCLAVITLKKKRKMQVVVNVGGLVLFIVLIAANTMFAVNLNFLYFL